MVLGRDKRTRLLNQIDTKSESQRQKSSDSDLVILYVTPLVHLLIAVLNNSAISGAITNCTHGVTHITPRVKSPKISTLAKRDSLVLIFWGIFT